MASVTQAPSPFSPAVRKFCRQISPNEEPVMLWIDAEEGSKPLNCFDEVRSRVERDGGTACLGWAIREWPGVFIDAEHHAVYRRDDDELIDITPALDGERKRLFLPDSSAIYDFEEKGVRRDNIRQALSRDPLIPQLFAVASRVNQLLDSVPGFGEVKVPIALARELRALEMEKLRLAHSIGMKHTGRNAPCFCGSGRKFKKCCGVGERS